MGLAMAYPPEVDGFSTDAIRAEVARIVTSKLFRSSQVLQNLLTYVVNARLTDEADNIKEYTLATQVLNQPPTFDSRVNNVVRVHAHRLRQRLHDYYDQEGNTSVLIIDLPKGGYVPHFVTPGVSSRLNSEGQQEVEGSSVSRAEVSAEVLSVHSHQPLRRIHAWHLVIAVLFGLCLGLVLSWMFLNIRGQAPRGAASPASDPLAEFWGSLWNNPSPTLIAISNRTYLMSDGGVSIPYTGPRVALPGVYMHDKLDLSPYSDAALLKAAGRVQFNDALTGLGEAEAAYILGKAFSSAGRATTLRRSRLLQMQDLQNGNVIFLGAPVGQPLLDSLLANLDCQFREGGIERRGPHGVEQFYATKRDPESGALLYDYGLIAVLPSPSQDRLIVVLAGNWTYGTLAAAKFVTEPAGIATLLAYPGLTQAGHLPPYFEAVIRVELVQGQLGPIQLVAAHSIAPSTPH